MEKFLTDIICLITEVIRTSADLRRESEEPSSDGNSSLPATAESDGAARDCESTAWYFSFFLACLPKPTLPLNAIPRGPIE